MAKSGWATSVEH